MFIQTQRYRQTLLVNGRLVVGSISCNIQSRRQSLYTHRHTFGTDRKRVIIKRTNNTRRMPGKRM